MVQAYIFSILAAVYIAAATRPQAQAGAGDLRPAPPNRKGITMDSMTLIAVASIVTAGLTTGIGCMAPALGEGRASPPR